MSTAALLRASFEARRTFPLDEFQVRALDALDAGQSVLVAAPTGSGKTLVGEYAIARALADGAKAFYTTPLKALSNQKYSDFAREYGPSNVGLLTGDNSINGEAAIVVMTTEVLRNMIYDRSSTLDGLRYVVLDEVHYLQNPYRGAVWEEVIVHLPPEVDLVCLSATVSNAEEFADWIRTVRGATAAIIEERRPVELVHLYAVGEKGNPELHLMPTFVGNDYRPNPEAARLDGRTPGRPARGRSRSRLFTPNRVELVERLSAEKMLPAIAFIFSRAGCDNAVEQCLAAGLRLTTAEQRREIRRIAQSHTASLADDDLDVLGYDTWMAGMEAGFASHHAGMVPPMKEAVEEAFAAALIPAVFATETLSLGINMPARTVVIEKLSKFTGERHEFLTPGEYTQLTGRAGRRGIDDVGYAVVCWSPFVPFDQAAGLASRRAYALTSSFRPTYNMAANLVRRYPADVAHHLLNLSFAQYQADRDVVALERQLQKTNDELTRQRAVMGSDDVAEYRRLQSDLDAERREARTRARAADSFDRLKPGDVVQVGKRGGRVVVLKQQPGRGAGRVLAMTTNRDLIRLGPSDFDTPPAAVATVDLPRPFAPRSPSFRKTVAEQLRKVRVRDAAPPDRRRTSQLERALAEHPLAGTQNLNARLRAAATVERLERDAARYQRRVRGRSESLARQFDRVLRVLETWGYVEEWKLTDAGQLLARLYTESDLLVAESLRTGLLDGLTAPEVAALVSAFNYERRGPESNRPAPPVAWPTSKVAQRMRDVDRIWRDLHFNEDDAGLPETRQPDASLTPLVYGWADGDDLADILEDDELTGGDFVRHVKQCIDLLRQLADVAPHPETASAARAAADACFRGVVAASSAVTV